MHDGSRSTPAAGRTGRSQRPGFSYQIRLVGGEEGRQLEREQAQAIAEALRWLATTEGSRAQAAVQAIPQAGGLVEDAPASADVAARSCSPTVGWPYPLEVRTHAVGLVGVGQPVGEVAQLVGVHPATVRRWVRQAVRRWADLADAGNEQHMGPNLGAG